MNPVDGCVNLFKPLGASSAKAAYRLRRLTGQRKIGHAGTLDPAADGVLIACLGRATKLVEMFMDLPKVYRAEARLDVTSDTLDREAPLVPVVVEKSPTIDEVRRVLESFVGDIEQIPPLASALKIGGRPAYRFARGGQQLELPPRRVRVYTMTLLDYEWPVIRFEVRCGRGTYVRSLARDIGAAMGCGGCLTALTRTRVGPFNVASSWTPERLRDAKPEEFVIPFESARALVAEWRESDTHPAGERDHVAGNGTMRHEAPPSAATTSLRTG